jgi:hypothetical protein
MDELTSLGWATHNEMSQWTGSLTQNNHLNFGIAFFCILALSSCQLLKAIGLHGFK